MLTPFPTGTDASETISGKEYSRTLLKDGAGVDATGLVQDSPAPFTFLGRLKAIVDAVLRSAPATRIFAITASDSAQVSPTPRALWVLTDGNLVLRGTDATAVTIPVKAGQTIPFVALYVGASSTATVAGLA